MRILLFVILTSVFLSTPAFSQQLEPAEFGTPPVGTKVQWKNMSNGYTWTTTIRDDDVPFAYNYFTETGDERSVYIFCKFCEHPSNRIRVEDYGHIYPLDIGKKASLKRTRVGDSSRSWTHTIEVLEEVDINVPFGETPVRTYLIEEKIRADGRRWNGKRTFWYAPSLKQNLRVVDDATNDGKEVSYEVQQYITPD